MPLVTYVNNTSSGGNAKATQTMSTPVGIQIPNARSVGTMAVSNKTTSLRANPFNINTGVQNYGVTTKMGG